VEARRPPEAAGWLAGGSLSVVVVIVVAVGAVASGSSVVHIPGCCVFILFDCVVCCSVLFLILLTRLGTCSKSQMRVRM